MVDGPSSARTCRAADSGEGVAEYAYSSDVCPPDEPKAAYCIETVPDDWLDHERTLWDAWLLCDCDCAAGRGSSTWVAVWFWLFHSHSVVPFSRRSLSPFCCGSATRTWV